MFTHDHPARTFMTAAASLLVGVLPVFLSSAQASEALYLGEEDSLKVYEVETIVIERTLRLIWPNIKASAHQALPR